MFEGLQKDQLTGAIEAMLFVTDEPVGTIALADMLEVDPADVESALVGLRDKLEAENRGIQLREVAGGCTRIPLTTSSSRSTSFPGTRASSPKPPWKRSQSWRILSPRRAPRWRACAA